MTQHPLDVDLLIFDADGTLRECTVPGQPCPNGPDEWRLRPRVQAVLRSYRLRYWQRNEPKGAVELAVVSNQGGVALGYLSYTIAGQLLWELLGEVLGVALPSPGTMLRDPMRHQSAALLEYGLSVRWCPSHPDVFDMRRKPNPGMLWEALMEHHVSRGRALMVGDRHEDRLAAEEAGVPFLWAHDFFGWEE